MKKLISLFLIIISVFSVSAYAVQAATSETVIADGVVQKRYIKSISAGTQVINVLEIDLSNPRVGIKLLTAPEGVSYLKNVKTLASGDERVVAAINGDFFAWYSKDKSRGSAAGLNFSEGEMLSSPPTEEELASLVFTDSGAALTTYFKPRMSVTTSNGRIEEIGTLNKFDSLTKLAMYNSFWGKTLYCEGGNHRIAVVNDNRVTEIVSEQGDVEIPENGYLLAGLADLTDFFSNGIAVGDTLKTDLFFDPYFEDIETAVGGGTVLVKNGYKAEITHIRYGRDYRTAAGVSKDNQTLYFITVDKDTESIGISLSELQEFMLDIGIYDGINLDGGGSTQMVARSYGDSSVSFVNNIQNGYARPVANALAVTVKGGTRGELDGIVLKTDSNSVNVGESITASFVAYDELYYPVDIDSSVTAEYTFGGVDGEQNGNTFTPSEKGTLQITVSWNGKSAQKTVNVYDPDKYMNSDSRIYRVKSGEKVDVNVTAVTIGGELRNVPLNEISISVSNNLATVSNGVITAKKSGFGTITFKSGNFTFTSYLSVDGIMPDDEFGEPTRFTDDFETSNAHSLSYPSDTPSAYAISREQVKSGSGSGKLWFDFDNDITDLQSAYLVFDNPAVITRTGAQLTVDVYSPGFEKTLLKAMVTDADGDVRRISLGNLQNEGWHTYSVTLPNDIALPAKLSRLYTVESEAESKERGAIYFDNLTVISGGSGDFEQDSLSSDVFNPSVIITGGVAQSETLLSRVAALSINKVLEKTPISYSFGTFAASKNSISAQPGTIGTSGNVTVIQYKNDAHLEESLENSEKAVVVISNENLAVSNILKKYTDKDIFVVSSGEQANVSINDNIRFVTLPTLVPSIVTNQKSYVTLEIGSAKGKTVYNLRRIKLWE